MKNNKIIKSIFSVTGIVILAKLIGFVKQMFVSSVYGANIDTDIFNLSNGLICNIEYLLVQTLTTAFLTTYIYIKSKDENEARGFTVNVLKVFSAVAAVIILVLVCFSKPIAVLLAPTYDAPTKQTLSSSIIFFSFSLVLFVFIAVFSSLLNANKKFIAPQFIGINQSIVIILMVLFTHKYIGIKSLYVSFYLQLIINILVLFLCSKRYISRSSTDAFKDKNVRKLIKTIAPLLIGYSAIYVNQLVDKILTTRLPEGTVTCLGYSTVLSGLVSTFIVTMCSIFFSYITTYISNGNIQKATSVIQKVTSVFIIICVPITVAFIILSTDIVSIAFGRGNFTSDNIATTATALIGYSISFIAIAIKNIFSQVMYAYQDTKRPMINAVIGIVVNIILSIILSFQFGIIGITVASSIGLFVNAILDVVYCKKKVNQINLRPLVFIIISSLIGLVCCLFIGYVIYDATINSNIVVRFLLTGVSILTAYFAVIIIFLRGKLKDIFSFSK